MAVERSVGVKAHLLDIFQDTYSDVYFELATSRLVKGYVERLQKGEIQVDFRAYIQGIIRNKIFDNAERVGLIPHRRLSEKELFDRLVDSAKLETKRRFIGLAKARYAEDVRSYLLAEYPEPIDNVVDYFFEQFCERAYAELRGQQTLERGNVLKQLLGQFTRADYEKGVNYRARVPPMPEPSQVPLPTVEDEEESEEELLSLLTPQERQKSAFEVGPEELRIRRNVWWDQMLRGEAPDPKELEEQSSAIKAIQDPKEREGFVLCWACAHIMREGTEAMRRNLRIFLIHHLSHIGSKREHPEGFNLDADRLTLVDIQGLYLTWDEASRLLGKAPDYSAHARIKEKIAQEFRKAWEALFGEPYE